MRPLIDYFYDPATGPHVYRPVVGWGLLLVIATAIGFTWGGKIFWLLCATAGLVCAWRKVLPSHLSSLLLGGIFFALVAWRAACVHDRNAESLARLETFRGQTVDMIVTVSNDCHVVTRKKGGPYCKFSVDSAWFMDGTEIHGTNLLVNFYDSQQSFPRTGERWRIKARINRAVYRYRMVISAQGSTSEALPADSEETRPQYLLARVRNRLAEHLAIGVSDEEALLVQTMTLGTRQRLPYNLRKLYADTGIVHIFAISGLHVAIITSIFVWLIAWSGLFIRVRWLILFPILIAYLIMTGLPPSATRACIMAMIYCFAPCLMQKPDACSSFCLTVMGVLLISPGWIANVGAVLSFSVMGGLLLFIHPVSYFINKLFRSQYHRHADGTLPTEASFGLRFRRAVAMVIALSLAAWISALPFSLFFFGQVSIAGLILNLVVPSLAMLIVWSAALSIVSGFIFLPLAAMFNHFNAFLLNAITAAAEHLHAYTWTLITLTEPTSLTFTILFEILLVLIALWLRTLERHCRYRDPLDPLNYQHAFVDYE